MDAFESEYMHNVLLWKPFTFPLTSLPSGELPLRVMTYNVLLDLS